MGKRGLELLGLGKVKAGRVQRMLAKNNNQAPVFILLDGSARALHGLDKGRAPDIPALPRCYPFKDLDILLSQWLVAHGPLTSLFWEQVYIYGG